MANFANKKGTTKMVKLSGQFANLEKKEFEKDGKKGVSYQTFIELPDGYSLSLSISQAQLNAGPKEYKGKVSVPLYATLFKREAL